MTIIVSLQMDIASTLLESGADANAKSKAGFTPLHLSAQKGHYDMTNLLIEHGADPNHKAKVMQKQFIQGQICNLHIPHMKLNNFFFTCSVCEIINEIDGPLSCTCGRSCCWLSSLPHRRQTANEGSEKDKRRPFSSIISKTKQIEENCSVLCKDE